MREDAFIEMWFDGGEMRIIFVEADEINGCYNGSLSEYIGSVHPAVCHYQYQA